MIENRSTQDILSGARFVSAEELLLLAARQPDLTHEEKVILTAIAIVKLLQKGKSPAAFPGSLEVRRQTFALAHGLTNTQMKIYFLAAEQKTNKEIGKVTHLSPETVKAHLTVIFRKTGTKTRKDIIARATKDNLV